jgi:riboflavin transporter FmnP
VPGLPSKTKGEKIMRKQNNTRKMAAVAMLGAVGFVLMFLEISVPIMPVFIKLDFSELPAVLAGFAYGPVAGVAVCLLKNALHLLVTNTAGVGELSNFLLGIFFVVPAGLIYRKSHTRKGALIGAAVGCVAYALASVPINYFLIYPMFGQFVMPMQVILGMYQTLNPNVETLWEPLTQFNLPFNLFKEVLVSAITFLVYKKLSPILHGKKG